MAALPKLSDLLRESYGVAALCPVCNKGRPARRNVEPLGKLTAFSRDRGVMGSDLDWGTDCCGPLPAGLEESYPEGRNSSDETLKAVPVTGRGDVEDLTLSRL
jgi:hypothetical protein